MTLNSFPEFCWGYRNAPTLQARFHLLFICSSMWCVEGVCACIHMCMCSHVCICVYVTVLMWRSKGNFWDSLFLVHHVVLNNRNQVSFCLGGKGFT